MSIPQEPATADLPSSPSEAYALGFRHGWLDCFGAGESLGPASPQPDFSGRVEVPSITTDNTQQREP